MYVEAASERAAAEATVLVVDDDESVRQGIARLARASGFAARTFSSPNRFLRQPLPAGPACLVLDLMMDGLNGLEVQERLRRDPRQIPIVFLSGHGDVPVTARAMKGGADDFLEKPFRPTDLIGAIRRALARDRKASAARAGQDDVARRHQKLTDREREVMGLVVRGLLNKQVAAELGISEKTVKVHRGRVMEKMEADSLAELVCLAEQVEPGTPLFARMPSWPGDAG
jgi:FixJ family two-component response regulator